MNSDKFIQNLMIHVIQNNLISSYLFIMQYLINL